jgi:branched-chain amino acid transport system substrate-binding protein
MRLHRLSSFVLCLFALLLAGCVSSNTAQSPWGTPSQQASQTPSILDMPATPMPDTAQTQAPQTPAVSYASLPPVKVAILLPLSGPNASIGQAMLQSAQLALFDMGYENFELMPRDTQGNAQGGLQAATAAANDGAQLILGPLFSDAAKAAKGVAARKNLNIITFSTDWTLAGGNSFVMGFLPFSQVQRVTRFAAANGIRRIGLLAPTDKYGDAVTQSFEQNAYQNAIQISKNMRFDANDRNITPKLQPFTVDETGTQGSAPYEAVFMPIGGAQAGIIGSALSYYGLPPSKVRRLGTGLMDDTKLAGEQNLQGAWFAAPAPRARRTFERRYKDTFGGTPPRLSTLAYDATALAAVLAANGFQSTGRADFSRQALMNPNGFAGIDGIFRFRNTGLVERGLAVLEYRNGRIIEVDPAPQTFQSTGY